jgi:transcriptional regulator with XRE-family HTH domain
MSTEGPKTYSDGSVDAAPFLDDLIGEVETFGSYLAAIREGEGLSQVEFAAKLGVSKSHLCDIEKGRKLVSADRAARFAEILGYLPASFVELALQDLLNRAGLDLRVAVTPAEPRTGP